MIRIIILFLIAPISFNTVNPLAVNEGNPLPFPPGCAQIVDSLYADKNELTNIGYKEYQYWVKKIFGVQSTEYRETLLDTTVWEKVEGLEKLAKAYHVEEQYDYYPVVGITLDQARLYTQWRTERVMEMTLIEAGIISPEYPS